MNIEAVTCRPGRPKDAVKREEIVKAATTLFMENGYELTSMEAVARQAGVSKLTIYSHFADKSELFRAIIQYRCDKLGMPLSFLSEAETPVKQALLKIARHAVSLIFRADSIRLMRVVQAEALHHPEIVQIYYEVGPKRVKAAFADLLCDFDRQKQLSIRDSVRASEQFFSLLKGEMLQRTLMFQTTAPDEKELDKHIKATVDFFLAAYSPQKSKTVKS
ncbi:MAG: TetR/AcrR family transcriptional regulator [Alphaproteobacteria bacterium]